MSDLENMEIFGDTEHSNKPVSDLDIFKSILKERYEETGLYFYYSDEKNEYERSVIVNAKRELKVENLLEVREGPVTFLSVMKSDEVADAEDTGCIVKKTTSYLGEGLYFIISSSAGLKKAFRQCLPREDRGYLITGEEFKGKELLYHNYNGEYLYDPFNDVAFISDFLLKGDSLTLVHHQSISEIVDIKEVQHDL